MAVSLGRGRPTKSPSLLDLLSETILARQQAATQSARDNLIACADDPCRFVDRFISFPEGQSLATYQRDVLASLPVSRRIAVRSPRGAGKTATAAILLLWFALTRDALQVDWKVVTTAGAWRQLAKYLWPEVHKWSRRLRWGALGRRPFSPQTELLSLSLKLDYGEAFAVATDNPDLIEGAHAEHIFVIFDESKAIPGAIFDAAEGALSGGGAEVAYAAAFSTPGPPTGRFWELHVKREVHRDWHVQQITAQQAMAAGRLDPQSLEDRKRQWGETHPLYRAQVLAEFTDDTNEGVIPFSWVEQAQRRYEVWEQQGKPTNQNDPVTIGVDVARQGDDKTVLAVKRGPVIERLLTFARLDVMETTGHAAALLRAHPGSLGVVDTIGIGAGVTDRLREQQFNVEAWQGSDRAPGPDSTGEITFLNKRAWGYWILREQLDPAQEGGATLALPPDETLTEDLCAPLWKYTSSGRYVVEDKEAIRKRIGRSPDTGDAVMQAVAGEQGEALVEFF